MRPLEPTKTTERERQPVGWFDTGLDPERESSLLATHSQLCTASRREMSRFGRESDTLAYTRSPTDRHTVGAFVSSLVGGAAISSIGSDLSPKERHRERDNSKGRKGRRPKSLNCLGDGRRKFQMTRLHKTQQWLSGNLGRDWLQ